MKIKTRILATFLTSYIFVAIVTMIILGFASAYAMISSARRLVSTVSSTKAETVNIYLKSQKEVAIMLGASTVFRDFLKESSTSANFSTQKQRTIDRLKRTIVADPNINEIFIIDKNGKIAASTNQSHEGISRLNDDYFIQGKNKTFIRDVYFSDITKNIAWGLSTPIVDDATKNLLGIVVLRIDVDPFFQILATKSSLGKTWESFLVDDQKIFLTPSHFLGDKVILKTKVNTQNVNDCFVKQDHDHEISQIFTDYRGVTTIGTHAFLPETNWCLITKVDEIEIITPMFLMIGVLILITLVGAGFFALAGILFSKKITKPLEDLHKGVEIIQKGNLDFQVGIKSRDEIGDLSREFDKMTASIKTSRAEIDSKVKSQTEEILSKNHDLEDQQKAVLNILEDVNEEKNKVEILAKDLDKFKLAVEYASDHIVITDPDGIILYANQAVTRITGFLNSDIMGKKAGSKKLWGGLMDSAIYESFWKTIKQDKKAFIGEFTNHRKNGEKYVAEAHVAPILDNDQNVIFFVGIERDITHAKEVDRMKTEFISLASHQLRTPLSAMKWFGEMLLNGDAGELTTEQKEFVTNIYQSNERMIELVNALLNSSRIESGRIIVDPKPTNLEKLLNEVIVEIKNTIDEKKQNLIISVHPDLPEIRIDPKLIREVYKNLLTNAVKYTPTSGEISIFISKNEDQIISQVSDSGYGIPAPEQQKVFQKFYRGTNVVKLETEGTGLGLYLVKAIIESSGGKLWFKSEENKGSTFWFSLPLSGSIAKSGEVGIDS
jgi:PAS domain S-box-containing protein